MGPPRVELDIGLLYIFLAKRAPRACFYLRTRSKENEGQNPSGIQTGRYCLRLW
jgi:hypothetical protein